MWRSKFLHRLPYQLVMIFCLLLMFILPSTGSFAAAHAQTAPTTPEAALPPASHRLYLPLLRNGVASPDTTTTVKLSTPALINLAFAQGEITTAERALYLAYALYKPQSLPVQFQSKVGWSGTQYVVEVENYMQSVSASATDAVQQELSRLSVLAATVCDNEDGANSTNSTHFHFNYDTIGGGLAIGDYITSMEATFGVEVTDYGWAEPPLCTGGATCSGNTNPFGRYPIQISSALGGGIYGYVTNGGAPYTGLMGDNPNTPATEIDARASCMVLNDNFAQFPEGAQDALDATTGHEFVHAIQFGYGDPIPREDNMWYESGAAYMEDEVFDASNSNYQYLWPVITNSLGQWPNGGDPGHISEYSNFLFFRHVAEHNGGTNTAGGGENIMQHFWENVAAGQAALTAYNNALVTAGTNLADVFHKYAIAAKFSKACGGGYVAPYCFEEGAAYVTAAGGLPVVQGSIATNPGSYPGSIENHYAANWVTLPTSGSPYQVTLNNTATGGQLRGSLVCDTGSAFTITPFPSVVSSGGSTAIGSFNASGCTSVVAVITNQEQLSGNPSSTTAASYTLAVSAADTTPPSVTINQASGQADPTSSSPINFTVVFNEAVSGFTGSDVSFTGSTAGGTLSAVVTGGPTTYNVAVSGMTSSGTVVASVPANSASDGAGNGNTASTSTDNTVTFNLSVPGTPTIVISSDSNGSVPGLSFRDEDIIAYNPTTQQWSMVFDGSDVGVGNVDVDGFAFLPNGHLLLSVDKDFTLSGFGAVDESDILEFIPSSYGPTTSGRYQMYFDGSDVGLDKSDEDVDAIDFDASGNLLISVDGAFNAQNVKGADEDLFKLSGFTPGANTSGTWSLYFDGSDVSLTSSGEDIFGLWADHANSKLYLTTHDNFSVPGVSGDKDDIFVCRCTSLGANTACTFSLFWNGDTVGFNQDAIDGLSIGTPPAVVNAADSSDGATVDDTVEYAGDDANEPNPLDGEETTDEAAQNHRILLPLITR